jgi:hypothetical protein
VTLSHPALRAVIAALLFFHGIGHLMGVAPALELAKVSESSPAWLRNWSSHSWLVSGPLGEGGARAVSLVLFLAVVAGMVGASLAILGWGVPYDWWRGLAIASAAVSLAAITLYWNAFIFFFPHKVGALAMSIAVLVCLLWADWPTDADLL